MNIRRKLSVNRHLQWDKILMTRNETIVHDSRYGVRYSNFEFRPVRPAVILQMRSVPARQHSPLEAVASMVVLYFHVVIFCIFH